MRDSRIAGSPPAEVKLTCGSGAMPLNTEAGAITSGAGAAITLDGTDVKIERERIGAQAVANRKFIASAALDSTAR